MDLLCDKPKQTQTKLAKEELKIKCDDKEYKTLLEITNDGRIKITSQIDLSQLKWSHIFSYEQIIKLHKAFLACDTLEDVYGYLSSVFQSSKIDIELNQSQMILKFSLTQHTIQMKFQIILQQEEINLIETICTLNNTIVGMQKKIEELEVKSLNKQDKQTIEKQENVINKQNELIEKLQNRIDVITKENSKMKQDIEDKQNLVKSKKTELSNILDEIDVKRIGDWIHGGNKNMNLKLVYRATTDGFQTYKFYEKCQNISPTLVLIKTNLNRRFGGYTELLWQNNNQSTASNPNKSFLFSLDLNKIYKSSDPNCPHAIYGCKNYFGFGLSGDININSMSNENKSSFSRISSYGKSEGLQNDTLAGEEYFKTLEIEVFQVILN